MGDSVKRRSIATLARCGMTVPQIPAEESAEGVVKVIKAITSYASPTNESDVRFAGGEGGYTYLAHR